MGAPVFVLIRVSPDAATRFPRCAAGAYCSIRTFVFRKPDFNDAIDVICYVALCLAAGVGIGAIVLVLMIILK
jgi:hypothetical protein